MDLCTLRTLYATGNYPQIISQLSSAAELFSPEFCVLMWKGILKGTGEVSKCAQFLASLQTPISELLKKSLMLWSKIYKNSLAYPSITSPNNSDVMAVQEMARKAHETVEMDQDERDQIILISAESLLMLSATSEAFSLLKLLKASNLDCQVMFIEILISLGQFELAQERLQKMKNIPEWKDDIRYLLAEALLGLHQNTSEEVSFFGVKDSLYSYQELIQVHGSTPRLLLHLAAAFILLQKFQEAQTTLLQIPSSAETDPIVKANLIVLSSLLNSPSFSSSLNCSVACCKVHKNTCSEDTTVVTNDTLTSQTAVSSNKSSQTGSLADKLAVSTRLQTLLNSSPYLSSHLPVLLARIDRHDSSQSQPTSQLSRDLERKERIAEVLKEAIDTDPAVAELYQILLEEEII